MINGFSVEVEEKHPYPIIHVKGEIDIYTCPKLRETLTAVIDQGAESLILNLEQIHYIDSTGLGTIAHTAQLLQSKNDSASIFIISTKPQIKKIFEVSGLEKKNISLFENESDVMKEPK